MPRTGHAAPALATGPTAHMPKKPPKKPGDDAPEPEEPEDPKKGSGKRIRNPPIDITN